MQVANKLSTLEMEFIRCACYTTSIVFTSRHFLKRKLIMALLYLWPKESPQQHLFLVPPWRLPCQCHCFLRSPVHAVRGHAALLLSKVATSYLLGHVSPICRIFCSNAQTLTVPSAAPGISQLRQAVTTETSGGHRFVSYPDQCTSEEVYIDNVVPVAGCKFRCSINR